ncbi:nucleoside-diphosphate-sugar epimerase [Roseimicrobium gellanilyticum]|uniref:Nucleoside-diphosphate-sugar epimerase n=2 Tax=Roseimicrobium gellanilyticum TaxID=748857 RepID=A0A366H754_9BACT|nr:nucleoside-diphosphate-sugar epimerase [Roseimicrobium gellanilyticum]
MGEIPWREVDSFAPTALIHLAWIARPGVNFTSPENDLLVEQSAALFRGLVERGVRNLTGTGTFIEYATCPEPLVEDVSPLKPLVCYSRAKLATLEVLRDIAGHAGVDWSWFRVFNAYGEGEDAARMTSFLMRQLAAGTPVSVKTPESLRDYIHAADVAEGMLASIESGLTGIVNIGTGEGVRVLELARQIAITVGADPGLVTAQDPPNEDLMPCAIADSSKLRSTGWTPRVNLENGLQRLWQSIHSATR